MSPAPTRSPRDPCARRVRCRNHRRQAIDPSKGWRKGVSEHSTRCIKVKAISCEGFASIPIKDRTATTLIFQSTKDAASRFVGRRNRGQQGSIRKGTHVRQREHEAEHSSGGRNGDDTDKYRRSSKTIPKLSAAHGLNRTCSGCRTRSLVGQDLGKALVRDHR